MIADGASQTTNKPHHQTQNLPDAEVVRVLWGCLLASVNMTGKNQQQILQAVARAVKTYHRLLAAHVTNARLELTLLVACQVRRVWLMLLFVRVFAVCVSCVCCVCVSSETSLLLTGAFNNPSSQTPSPTQPPPNQKKLKKTNQVACYEDSRLLKLFADVVKVLYSGDLVGEDAIQHWYKKGSHPKGRNVFLRDIEPFIKWLEEAEEEGDEDDDDE
jgi:hypothetical protein